MVVRMLSTISSQRPLTTNVEQAPASSAADNSPHPQHLLLNAAKVDSICSPICKRLQIGWSGLDFPPWKSTQCPRGPEWILRWSRSPCEAPTSWDIWDCLSLAIRQGLNLHLDSGPHRVTPPEWVTPHSSTGHSSQTNHILASSPC